MASKDISQFKEMQNKINQSVEKIRTELEELNDKKTYPLREILPNNGIDEYTHTLTSWTERSVGRILYEGKFEMETIKDKLINRKNIF